jgi:formylglycine-generating enzyme required for sulfatase activity
MQYVEGQTLGHMIATILAGDEGESLPTTMLNFLEFSEGPEDSEPTGSMPSKKEIRKTTVESMPRDEIMRVVKIFERAAQALHTAHEAGITHRDIKPGNIMLTSDGRPVILDFGLAQMEEDDGPTLTQSGDLFGTPAYMSPEQLTRHSIRLDRRTDVYSLGVTLYKCLTLADAFTAPTRQSLYHTILTKDAVDPRRLNPAIPPDLVVVLETAMEKDRDRRYKTAEAFAEDLQRVREYQPILARPPSRMLRLRRWTQRNPALATAVAALFLMLVGGLAFFMHQASRERGMRESHKLEVAPLEVERLLRRARDEIWPAVPAMVPAMKSWLEEIEVVRQEIRAHEARLEELRSRGIADAKGNLVFENIQDKWRYLEEKRLLSTMEGFKADDRFAPTIASMKARLALGERIWGETVEKYSQEWKRAAREVSTSPLYGDLELKPQVGLIPLGKDAESGLQEFAHYASGKPAVRSAETGKLTIGEETGMVLVLVPGGKFLMGRQSSEEDEPNYEPSIDAQWDEREGPPHTVPLSPFFVSKYEVSQAQWLRCTGKNPSKCNPGLLTGSRRFTLLNPVEMVTALDCEKVFFQLGLALPTEAQWEYACRAGTQGRFSTGDDLSSLSGYANLADEQFQAIEYDDGFLEPAPVGNYKPNPFGLHDMHGNVYEWCRDVFDSYEKPARDGDGLRDAAPAPQRTARGGSCRMDYRYARTTARQVMPQDARNWHLGVRPVRSLDR